MKHPAHFLHLAVLLLCMLGFGATLVPTNAFAQTAETDCNTKPEYAPSNSEPGKGMMSKIVKNIKTMLGTMAENMFNGVQSGLAPAVRALLTLYIAVYGVLFTFGMAQTTLYDFSIRMIKFAIIATLTTGGAWALFNDVVGAFFDRGTDQLIGEVTGGAAANPFDFVDTAVAKVTSAKMAAILAAVATTGPMGPFIGLLLVGALGMFLKALMTAVWVYLMAMVIRTLLFGLAPIFLSCILFTRTRHLFEGWLNQLVNTMLQPVLLFVFFSFFVSLLEGSIDEVMGVTVCWSPLPENVRATSTYGHYYRPALPNGQVLKGAWTFKGSTDPASGGIIFPLDIMVVLVFLLLGELVNRFNSAVLSVASDLSNVGTNLAAFSGPMGSATNRAGGSKNSLLGGSVGGSNLFKNAGAKADAEAFTSSANTEGFLESARGMVTGRTNIPD